MSQSDAVHDEACQFPGMRFDEGAKKRMIPVSNPFLAELDFNEGHEMTDQEILALSDELDNEGEVPVGLIQDPRGNRGRL